MKETGAIHDRETGTCTFRVWAPLRGRVEVKIIAPVEQVVPMDRDAKGYWQATVQGIGPGARYVFRLENDRDRPDPASRNQPEGVHGPFHPITWHFRKALDEARRSWDRLRAEFESQLHVVADHEWCVRTPADFAHGAGKLPHLLQRRVFNPADDYVHSPLYCLLCHLGQGPWCGSCAVQDQP